MDQSPQTLQASLVSGGDGAAKKTKDISGFIYVLIWLFLSHSVLRILHVFEDRSYIGCVIYCIFYPARPVCSFIPVTVFPWKANSMF